MNKLNKMIGALVIAAIAAVSATASATVNPNETLRYDWKLRGALSWVASVRFPTSGTGVLQNRAQNGAIASHLRVNAGGRDYIEYASRMDPNAHRTYSSVNGYAFGAESERKETTFDYNANVAIVKRQADGKQRSDKTRPLVSNDARDVLTTIAYLREPSRNLNVPFMTDVYADGKPYRVVVKPAASTLMPWQGRNVATREIRVVAAPGVEKEKKFPGMSVWLTSDLQRLPLRIVIEQPFASLDLRLRG